MSQVYFIWGNQALDLERTSLGLIERFCPTEQDRQSLYQFNAPDLFKGDQEGSALFELKNCTQSVSFFGGTTLVRIRHLEAIPKAKGQVANLEKKLKALDLVLIKQKDQDLWFDRKRALPGYDPHRHLNLAQIVSNPTPLSDGCLFLEIKPHWAERLIHATDGSGITAQPFREFLSKSLGKEVRFDPEQKPMDEGGAIGKTKAYLLELFQSPPDDVVILAEANVKNPNNSKEFDSKLFKALSIHGQVIKTTVAYDDFRPIGFVIQEAKAKGLIIEREIADLLIEISGSDMGTLSMELEKMLLRFGEQTRITEEMVMSMAGRSRSFSHFRISHFLSRKNLSGCIEALETVFFEKQAEPPAILGLIAAEFRRLYKVALLADQGQGEKAMISALGLNPWIAKQTIQNHSRFTIEELENILIEMSRLDLKVKFRGKDALLLLENLCSGICRGQFVKRSCLPANWVP